jgi:L-threonylcarbamoyladenylate synthase
MPERIFLSTLLEGPSASVGLDAILKRIEAGEVFVYPTETIYGIGGRADNKDVERKILRAKKRPPGKSMILLAGNREMFIRFGVIFPYMADVLAKHFWPGNLTMVLPLKNSKETVGVRISGHPLIKAFYGNLEAPVFSTSANLNGQPYINDPDEIYSIFGDKIDFMIDAGALPSSPPSTVIKIVSDNKIELLREGVIPKEKIMSIVMANM